MNHSEQLADVRQKIFQLEREQQRISGQIKAYKQIRDALEVLSKSEPSPAVGSKSGPTEAIRVILGKHPDGLTPREIRAELLEYGIGIGSPKNFMSNIHAIIRRDKNIEQVGVGGRKLYKLVSDVTEN